MYAVCWSDVKGSGRQAAGTGQQAECHRTGTAPSKCLVEPDADDCDGAERLMQAYDGANGTHRCLRPRQEQLAGTLEPGAVAAAGDTKRGSSDEDRRGPASGAHRQAAAGDKEY